MPISNHRKLLPFLNGPNQTTIYYCNITTKGTTACFFFYSSNSPPSPPSFPQPPDFSLPPPPPIFFDQAPQPQTTAHQISPLLIVMASILGSLLFLLTYFFIILKFCSCHPTRRSTTTTAAQTQQTNSTLDDFLDENLGLVVDNPIWYINTVGLDPSVINSIAKFKYKKGDGLVEGTDCSVCLSEFREDETLRLLPKCSHAFHLPCIDTWLRSHKNCPLCRAAVVSNSGGSGSAGLVMGSDDSGQRGVAEETTRLEGLERNNGRRLESEEDRRGDDDDHDEEIGDGPVEFSNNPISKSGIRVVSDLVDNHRGGIQLQPVRRSVSMDFSVFCFSLGNLSPLGEPSGESSGGAQLETRIKSNLAIVPKNSRVNPFLLRLNKSPLSMKRSLSSGRDDGKRSSSSSRHSRNRSSLLPL